MKASTTDSVGLALLGAWLVWVVVTASLNHHTQPLMTPYFTPPLTLLAGVLLGRRLARKWWLVTAGVVGAAASETSLVSVLLAALVATGFAMATRGRPAATLAVSAALAALLIHSFVDYLLEYWPVVLVMAVSLGYATLAYAASNIVVATPGGSTAT